MIDQTTRTPVEIDTDLAALYDTAAGLRLDSAQARRRLFSTADRREEGSKVSHWDRNPDPEATLDEVLALLRAKAEGTSYTADYAVSALKAYDDVKAALAANAAAQAPLHAEYRRRGGWTRAFLVLSSNGHVHSSMDCSTCFEPRWTPDGYKPGTEYGWLPSLSGHTEAEIVDAAGADACTVCYPTAPVVSLSRPRRVLHHTEEAAAAARAERDAAKIARAAAKEAKMIANPDGSPLSVFDWHCAERHMQQRDGSVRIEPAYDRFETLETLHAAKSWLTDSQEGYRPKRAEDVQRVAVAIAHKGGTTTPEQEIEAAKKRAAKRR